MGLKLDDLRGPECARCGASLEGKRADAVYCSRKCYMDDYHQLERDARLEVLKDRPPCRVCSAAIPAEADPKRVYCSITCQRVVNDNKACGRYPKTCEHCGKAFNAHNRQQRFCSQWCRGQGGIRKLHSKPCEWCGTEFQPRRSAARFCCSRCAARARVSKRDAAKQ